MNLHLSHTLLNFWNDRPNNGAFHHLVCKFKDDFTYGSFTKPQQKALAGESLVANLAIESGWKVLFRQIRHTGFELDLVMAKDLDLKILEVKTRIFPRSRIDSHSTISWMNSRKVQAISRGAHYVVREMFKENIPWKSVSCDLVAVDIERAKSIHFYRWPNACNLK